MNVWWIINLVLFCPDLFHKSKSKSDVHLWWQIIEATAQFRWPPWNRSVRVASYKSFYGSFFFSPWPSSPYYNNTMQCYQTIAQGSGHQEMYRPRVVGVLGGQMTINIPLRTSGYGSRWVLILLLPCCFKIAPHRFNHSNVPIWEQSLCHRFMSGVCPSVQSFIWCY